jgi:hypothetical protein
VKRKLVQAVGSLAVTLPAEVVKEFELKKGAEVDISVHPQTGAVTIRPGVRYLGDGKVTPLRKAGGRGRRALRGELSRARQVTTWPGAWRGPRRGALDLAAPAHAAAPGLLIGS